MNAFKLTVVYVSMAVFLIIIDSFWSGVLAKEFYRNELAIFMAREVSKAATIPLYLIYVAGIELFAVLPSQAENSLTKALFLGAALGFFAYATHNFTNLSMLRAWPLSVVVVDLIWGILLTCITAAIGFIVVQKLP